MGAETEFTTMALVCLLPGTAGFQIAVACGAHLYRALVGNLGVGFVFWAYAKLPMADATALLFAAPLFVAALSPLLLKERMGRRRWIAVTVGFVGVLFIVRPSAALLANPASLVGLAAALRLSEASLPAPYPYTSILWATAIGWLIWKDLPTFPVVLGTAVVIGSNLFILWRERC